MRRIEKSQVNDPSPSIATYFLTRAWVIGVVVVSLAGLSTGCGSAFSEILFQAASAVGRSALDVTLTDVANDLAEASEQQGGDAAGDDDTVVDDAPGDVGDGTDVNPPDDAPVDDGGGGPGGDAESGRAVFANNGCEACHCADASGGCALSAPGLAGVSMAELESRLTGVAFHPIKPDLTSTELADLEAYLGTVGG